MNSDHYLRKAVAAAAGIILACALPTDAVLAVDTTVTDASTAVTAVTTTTNIGEDTEITEETEDWFKAEIDEYDDSLSLISYKTSPEASKNGKKKDETKGPKPVALNVTGGYVGDIPFFESEPEIDAKPGQFAVVTYGWGHGVGMSQNGANFYARYSNWTYQDILFHYYPGTYLMDTGLAYDETITVNGVTGDVLSMVSQIVFNEVGGSMSYEAIKAQAVAVYTYCKYNNNDSRDLRCKPNPPRIVVEAVTEVLGQALYYDGDFALTMFSASSGGITANCYEVFYKDLPYLRSVSSDYDGAYDPHYGTVTYIDDFQLRNMIEEAYHIKLSDDPYNWLKPEYSDATGYVTYVNIDDQKRVKGYDLKLAIGLKSSKFNLFYAPRPDGEKIPSGSSDPVVVDPNYTPTPGVNYPNNYPTDIDTVTPPVTTVPEYTEPDWTTETTEPYYDPAWDEPIYTEPSYGYDPTIDYNYGSEYDYGYDYSYGYDGSY